MPVAGTQRDMNPQGHGSGNQVGMVQTNEDLLSEVKRLRGEIQQLREVVNALFNAVFEENEEEGDPVPHRHDDFSLYN